MNNGVNKGERTVNIDYQPGDQFLYFTSEVLCCLAIRQVRGSGYRVIRYRFVGTWEATAKSGTWPTFSDSDRDVILRLLDLELTTKIDRSEKLRTQKECEELPLGTVVKTPEGRLWFRCAGSYLFFNSTGGWTDRATTIPFSIIYIPGDTVTPQDGGAA